MIFKSGIRPQEPFRAGDPASQYEQRPMANSYPPQGMLSAAFHEVKTNPPKILAKTRRKSGAARARKQAIAIAISKAKRGY